MKKIFLITFLLLAFIDLFSQKATLTETTEYLKNNIQNMCSQFGSKFIVNTDKCQLDIYETMDDSEKIDTVNFYHIDLANISDTTLYSQKEKFGITKITIKGFGCYMISYFNLLGEKSEIRTNNQVLLPFKTKGIDRINFVNKFDKALQHAKDLCQLKF